MTSLCTLTASDTKLPKELSSSFAAGDPTLVAGDVNCLEHMLTFSSLTLPTPNAH